MASSNTPFISKSTAYDAYDESRKWLRPYFEPIEEFERLARNRPSPRIAANLPKITDGTLAAIVQETPKRVVQQTPSGLVRSKQSPELSKVADIVLRDELVPRYNRQGDMLQKSWNMIGKSMTWGRSTSYTFFTSTNGVFHTDFVIPYVKDVLTEKGKVFAGDSNVRFLRSWYTKRDLKAILNSEKKREEQDKKYKSEWNLTLLADFMTKTETTKPAEQQTPAEREKGDGYSGGFEVIHAFQDGVGAEFYSFSPQYENGVALRVRKNPDPRGKMPFDDMYLNIDLSNPLGRGSVELSAGVQNLMDQQMQMFQFMSTMEMAPPLKVFGSVNKASLKMAPNAVWDMGTGGNNQVEPYALSNFALQNFGNNYGLLKSQIMGLNSSQDSSVSSESGNPTQSKTQAGVEQQQQRLGVSDNYIRKQYEAWYESQSETSLNIHFSERTGTHTYTIDKDDLAELQKTSAAKYLSENGREINVPYKDINDVVLSFEVDAGSSEVKESEDNSEKLAQVLQLAQQSPDPAIQSKVPELFKLIIKDIGAEGTDELFPEDQTDENGQPVNPDAAMQGQPQQPQINPEEIQMMVQDQIQEAMGAMQEEMKASQPDPMLETMKALGIKFTDLPEDARQQVLAQLGLETTLQTPADHQQDMEDLKRLDDADPEDPDETLEIERKRAEINAMNNPKQGANESKAQEATEEQGMEEEPMEVEDELSEDEMEVAQAMLERGMSDDDVEQAVMLMRRGESPEAAVETIARKYV